MTNSLSLCMIVKNEERDLPRCLDSVRDLVSQTIVVDTGSADNSVTVAKRYGAEVIPFDFTTVDFAAARNHALARARGKWILVLDADETFNRTDLMTLQTLTRGNENIGYFVERCNQTQEKVSFTDWVVRLFPNRLDYRYRGRVHETVDRAILSAGGQLRKSGIRIDHRFSADNETRRRKNHWYIEILKEEIATDPSDDSRLDFLAAEYHQLGMFNEATAVAERIAGIREMDPSAHLFAGVYHLLYQSNLARARHYLKQALALQPVYPEAESFLKLLEEREGTSDPVVAASVV